MSSYNKLLKSLAMNVNNRATSESGGGGTSNNYYTTGATLGGDNVLTGSTQATTWTANLNALAGTTTPGGSDTQVQFNNGGAFGGDADMTFDGTNLTLANDLIVGRKVKHNGDENNYIEFTTDDIDFNIDSKSFMRFTEVGTSGDKIVFNEGSNNIDFRIESDDDANMFVMDAGSNKIGIGTALPGQKLHVEGSIAVSGAESAGDSGYGHSIRLYNQSGSQTLRLYSDSRGVSGEKRQFIDASGRLSISSTENMGIGPSVSGEYLHLFSGDTSHMYLDAGNSFLFRDTDDSDAIRMRLYTDSGKLLLNDSSAVTKIQLQPSGDSYITNNLGIGMTSPSQALSLPDNAQIALGDNPDLKIYHNGSHSFIQDQGTGELRLLSSKLSLMNASEGAVLTMDGSTDKIGIGTTAPTAKFEVMSATNSYEQARFQWDASNYLGVFVNSGGDSQLESKEGHLTLKTDTSAHNVRVDTKGDFRVDLGDSNGGYAMRLRAFDGTGLLYAVSDGPVGIGTESNTTEALWITDEASPDADTNLILQQGSGGGGGFRIYDNSAAAAGLFGMNSSSNLQVQNSVQDKDILFSINDGGAQTTAMVIDGDVNRVGIGTTTPSAKLHLMKASAGSPGYSSYANIILESDDHNYFQFSGPTNKNQGILFGDGNDNAGAVYYDHASNYMRFFTNGSEQVRIDSAGQVGIGTNSPAYALDVSGAVDVRLGSGLGTDVMIAGTNHGITRQSNSIKLYNNAKNAYFGVRDSATGFVQISGSNVGIGTESPAFALDVNGDIRIEDAHFLRFGNDDSNSQWAIQHAGNDLNFAEVGVADNVLFLEAGGNVGIGTSAPNQALDVVGNQAISGYIGRDTHNYIDFGTDNVIRFRINDSMSHQITTSSSNVVFQPLIDGKDIIFQQYDGDEVIRLTDAKNLDLPSNNAILFDNTNDNNQSFIRNGGTNAVNMQFGLGTPDNANVKMILDGNGQVGIGTTTPSYKLDVMGEGRFVGKNSHQTLELRGDTNYGAYINYVRNNGSYAFRAGMITNSSRWDITDYQGAGYEALSVLSDLKVGINETSPPSTLGIDGAVSIKERADHETVTADYGQIWVKNASPNELYFTDDAGTDHQLGAGGGGGGDVSKVGTPANNQIGVWTGDGTIEGDANFTWDASQLALTGTSSHILTLDPYFAISGDDQYGLIHANNGLALSVDDSHVDLWASNGRKVRVRQRGSGDAYDGTDNTILEIFKTGSTSTGGPWGAIIKAPSGNLALQTAGAYDLILDSHDSLQMFFDNEYTMYSAADGNARFMIREHSKAGMEFEGDGDITFKDQTTVNMTLTSGGSLGVGMTPDNQSIIDFQGKLYGTVNGTTKGNFSAGASSFAHTSGLSNYNGSYSTGIGFETMKTLSGNAHRNTAVGYRSMFGDSTGIEGTDNTAVGASSMLNIKDAQYNVAVGVNAAQNITDGHKNVAVGTNALKSVTTGENLVAIGYLAGDAQTTDDEGSIYIGSSAGSSDDGTNRNIFIGFDAGNKNTTGANNLAIGHKALEDMVSGIHNVAIGREAGKELTGNQNVAVGTYALQDRVAGYYNTVVGDQAMRDSTAGDKNVILGTSAMGNDTVGTGGGENVVAGFAALRKNTGQYNVVVGSEAATAATALGNSVVIGRQAMGGAAATGIENVAIGFVSMLDNTSGPYNVAVGAYAATGNTTGQENTAVGHSALQENQEGDHIVAIGRYAAYNTNPTAGTGDSVVVGTQAGYTNTTGVQNTFVGHKAAYSNTTANQLVMVGREAGYNNTTGSANVFVGARSGYNNVSGSLNTAIGYQALYDNNATSNVAIGHQAGQNVTTGGYSVYIGDNAGRTITDAGVNVMVGYQAGYPLGSSASANVIVGGNAAVAAHASVSNSVLIGQEAGYSTSGQQVAIGKQALYFPEGNYNVAIGQQAMYGASATTTAQQNVAVGRQSLFSIEDGQENVAVGDEAGYSISAGNYNVGLGSDALRNVTTGLGNIGIGRLAGSILADHNYTVAIGYGAAQDAVTTSSVIIGHSAGYNNNGGDNNVFIGKSAGVNVTTGGSNVMIGPNAGPSSTSTTSNELYIGNSQGSTPLIKGDFSSPSLTVNGDLGVTGSLSVTGSTLAVQKTMKNDIAGTHTLSDSYSHYMATGDNQTGSPTCTMTCPANPVVGDEYFIVAQCIYNSAMPSNALVQITPNTGQTINMEVNAGSNIAIHQVSSGTGAGGAPVVSYKTAHLICIDSGQWVLTVSDVGPTS